MATCLCGGAAGVGDAAGARFRAAGGEREGGTARGCLCASTGEKPLERSYGGLA
jgi:hypothetical protein